MATSVYTYDALLTSMQNRFTIVKDNCTYTLGGYMRTKAAEKTKGRNLPASVAHAKAPVAVRQLLTYVSDKLAVKQTPPPERTLTSFPFRTALTSLAAALVLCTTVFAFARVGMLNQAASQELPALHSAESVIEENTERELTTYYATL